MRTFAVAVLTVASLTLASVASAGGLLSPTQVVVDEEIAVSAGGSQLRTLVLKRGATLQVEVKGVKHSDKGFDLYVLDASETKKVEAGGMFEHYLAFAGVKITGAVKTHDLPAGEYTVLVRNRYNLLRGMVVRLKVTVDP